jgi:hypothetical protein
VIVWLLDYHLIENHFQITRYQHLFLPRSYSVLPMTITFYFYIQYNDYKIANNDPHFHCHIIEVKINI